MELKRNMVVRVPRVSLETFCFVALIFGLWYFSISMYFFFTQLAHSS